MLRPRATEHVAGLRRDHVVSEPLRPFVERYWSVRWDRRGQPPFRSEVLSHPSVNVSVEQGTQPRFGLPMPAVLVHAVVTRRFVVDLVGAGSVVAVKFRPGGFAAMTGTPPARDTVAPLGDELGVDAGRLLEDVLAQDADDDRAAALDAALAPAAREPDAAYLELVELLAVMVDDRDLVRVEQVAAWAGTTVRGLQRLFSRYVGVGPKAVLARYRLQDAVARIDAGEVDDLAALAASLGWFDQAHFSRDFRAVVGTTPSAYLAHSRGAPGAVHEVTTGRPGARRR
ncbi:helix-turn-helix domain-containing protein [Thalassiella azotivora]